MVKFVILGAGMTGLSTAYHLKKNYFLAEKTKNVGGLAGSIEIKGYLFDYAEHFLRIPNKYLEDLFKKLMGDNIFSQELVSAIYFKKKYIPYPFQENIRELPPIELEKYEKSLKSNLKSGDQRKQEFESFEDFIYYQYGGYIANEFMIPYNEKIWSIKPNEMNASWFLSSNFIPVSNIGKKNKQASPTVNERSKKKHIRWYPVKGGSQEFGKSFTPFLNHLVLNHEAIRVDVEKKEVFFKNGFSINYEDLISTIPLPELLNIINNLPSEIRSLIPKLKYNSVYCINFCLNRKLEHKYHWLYFPQKDIPFSRLFFSSNFSKNNAPTGKGSCSAIMTYLPDSKINLERFEEETIQILLELGLLKNETEIVDRIPINIKYGFTLPTIGIENHLKKIMEFLSNNNIYSIGRYGEWKYSGIEHAIEDGRNIATRLSRGISN